GGRTPPPGPPPARRPGHPALDLVPRRGTTSPALAAPRRGLTSSGTPRSGREAGRTDLIRDGHRPIRTRQPQPPGPQPRRRAPAVRHYLDPAGPQPPVACPDPRPLLAGDEQPG